MAFPTVASASFSSESAGTTTHDALIPTGTADGDLMIALVTLDKNAGINLPSGWTGISAALVSGGIEVATWYRFAGASESDFTWTSTSADQSVTVILRITNWHGTTPPEATAATGTSTSPDSPDLNPTGWAVEDTLWVSWFGVDNDNQATAFPTNFNDNQDTAHSGGGGGCAYGRATRENAVASENPGAFTIGSEQWAATTIAIRPLAAAAGRIMSSLVAAGGLVGAGGIAGSGGGLAG